MRKFLICMIILASSLLSALQLERSEAYIEFEISSLSELNKLSRIISIDDISGKTVTANVNQKELDQFESFGYSYRLLPREHLTGDFMASELDYGEMRDWDSYPTYEAYTEMMYQFAQDYPDICTVTSLGTSVQGRELLIAKISDNPEMTENEPEFLYIGQLHGDELVTYMLLLRLIDHLLENYELDDRITDLINNTEIWINPLANPDGTYAGGNHTVNGAIRRNANNVDLNRNFPDMLDGDHPDGNDWQPETEILMELARNKNFVLSSNFHSGAEVVNYPWDRIQTRHADDDWWQIVSHRYADTVHEYAPAGYMDGFNNGISNGFDWYSITGGHQDYVTYFHHSREMTLELSDVKMLPADQLRDHWDYNRESLIQYMEECQYGIRGIVLDDNDQPVQASIRIPDHDQYNSDVLSDQQIGNYHRMLAPGTYDLEVSCFGYISQSATGITVTDQEVVILDFILPLAPLVELGITVVDELSEEPLPSVRIDFPGTPLDVFYTDDCGSILITDFPSGEYQIRIIAENYLSQNNLINVSPSNSAFTFQLEYTDAVSFENGEFSENWTSGGNSAWIIDDTIAQDGIYSARSGAINNNQNSQLSISMDVTSESYLSFYRKVSCEAAPNDNYDFLAFLIDGIEQDRWDGEADWAEESYLLQPGQHSFTWKYSKDGSVSEGQDCAWIDFILFPDCSIETFTVNPDTLTAELTPDQTASLPLTLNNDGENALALEFSLSEPVSWITDPEYLNFELGANGTSQEIELEINSTGLSEGLYTVDLIITYTETRATLQVPVILTVTAADQDDNLLPETTEFLGNYPNPFQAGNSRNNSGTTLSFSLAEKNHVDLKIYNLKGELVKVLEDNILIPGKYSYLWDGSNLRNGTAPAGIYLSRLSAGDKTFNRKILLLK